MRYKPLISAILLVAVVATLIPLPVSAAHTAQNLTLTAGGGSWVTGGYNFSRSYATKASFQPVDGVSAFSIVAWVKPATITGDRGIFSQLKTGPDWNSRVEIYFTGDDVVFKLGTGAACLSVIMTDKLLIGRVYMVALTWDKTDNSGKMNCYLYNANTSVWVIATDSTGNTGACAADGDFYLGARTGGSTLQFQGKIFGLGIYTNKLSNASLTKLATLGNYVSDYFGLSTAQYYYTLQEGSGTTLNDWADTWWDAETWSVDILGNVLQWWGAENWTIDLLAKNITWHIIEIFNLSIDALNAFAWRAVEAFGLELLVHNWFPSMLHDPLFFVFLAGIIGSIVCVTITLIKIKTHDVENLYRWILFDVILICITLGVLL